MGIIKSIITENAGFAVKSKLNRRKRNHKWAIILPVYSLYSFTRSLIYSSISILIKPLCYGYPILESARCKFALSHLLKRQSEANTNHPSADRMPLFPTKIQPRYFPCLEQ